MNSPNEELDHIIRDTLFAQSHLPRTRKQTAWEKVRYQATAQTILQPTAVQPAFSARDNWSRLAETGHRFYRWLSALAVDESSYDRARQQRYRLIHINSFGSISYQAGYRWVSQV